METLNISSATAGEIISRNFSARPDWIQISIGTSYDAICVDTVYFHKQKLDRSRFWIDYPRCDATNLIEAFGGTADDCYPGSMRIDLRNFDGIFACLGFSC